MMSLIKAARAVIPHGWGIMSSRRSRQLVLAGLVGFVAVSAGCTSFEDLSDLNPLAKKEVPLPGTRQSVFDQADLGQVEDSSPVSISGSVAFSSWGQVGGTLANNPPNVSFSGQGARIWSKHAALKGGKNKERAAARPVSVGGRIAVYSPDGKVSVFSAPNGLQVWSAATRPENEKGSALGGAVAMDSVRVVAATGFGQLIAMEARSGRRIWTFTLDGPARGAPVIAGDVVIAVSAANSVYAVNLSDGTQKWEFSGIPGESSLLAAASPAVSGNYVVFAGTSGELVALDLKSGDMRWSETIVQGARRFAVSGLSSITASPVVSDGIVYIASVAGKTAAFRLKTGERLWGRSFGSAHTPVVSGNSLFLLDLDDHVIALNRKTGKIRWSKQLPSIRERKKRSVWSGPVLAGNSLWFTSTEKQISAVNPADGHVRSIRKINEQIAVSPIAVGGRLITLSVDGNLSAYQ